jgi:hypothetical protein
LPARRGRDDVQPIQQRRRRDERDPGGAAVADASKARSYASWEALGKECPQAVTTRAVGWCPNHVNSIVARRRTSTNAALTAKSRLRHLGAGAQPEAERTLPHCAGTHGRDLCLNGGPSHSRPPWGTLTSPETQPHGSDIRSPRPARAQRGK